MNVQDYIAALPENTREIAAKLLPLIEEVYGPGVVWHGHPVWKIDKTPVAFFKAYKSYVTLGFWRGQELNDPRLTPANRQMAVTKLHTLTDIDPDLFTTWLTQAKALEA